MGQRGRRALRSPRASPARRPVLSPASRRSRLHRAVPAACETPPARVGGSGFASPRAARAAWARRAQAADSRRRWSADTDESGRRAPPCHPSVSLPPLRPRAAARGAAVAGLALRASDAEPRAPFGAARADHRPAAAGAHAHEKAVRPLAPDDGGLERSLHGFSLAAGRENPALNQGLANTVNDGTNPVDNFRASGYHSARSAKRAARVQNSSNRAAAEHAEPLAVLPQATRKRASRSAI